MNSQGNRVWQLKVFLFFILFLHRFLVFSQADIILYNGKIFTADKKLLWAEAVAVRGERIISVGKNKEVLRLKEAQTKMIDLHGRLVVPGFNDAHHHEGPSYHNRIFTFRNGAFASTTWEEARDSLAKAVSEVPAGSLITSTINPDLLQDGRVKRKNLDSIAPYHPVIFFSWTGHESILNSKALELIGYSENATFAGGILERDNEGKLSGVIREYGEFQIWSRLAIKLLTEAQITSDIRSDYQEALSWGITTDQVMTTNLSPQTFSTIFRANDFGCRIRLIAFPFTDANKLQWIGWQNNFHSLNRKNYISGVKLILDGSPVERDACMRKSYSNQPSNYGHLNFTKTQIREFLQFALASRQQIIVHAVGDSSVKVLIESMRSLHPASFWKNKRVRIEHGEFAVMNKKDLKTLRDYGIIIVQNPVHFSLPSVLTEMNNNYKGKTNYLQGVQSYLKNGIRLAIGSDGPNNPFLNIMMAVLHPNNPNEALNIEQAVIAYTLGSAYAEFKENEKGTIIKGKLADLAVLSQDIFIIPTKRIAETTSLLTLVGGKIVFGNLLNLSRK